MLGLWQCSFPDGEQNAHIEMRSDGHWTMSSPLRQNDPTSTNYPAAGTWSVHNRTLTLRTEKIAGSHAPPGLEFSNNIVSVSPEVAVFKWIDGKREVKWTRVHDKPVEPFWKRAISYEPPFKMSSYFYNTNGGPSAGDWEFHASARKETQTSFSISQPSPSSSNRRNPKSRSRASQI